MSSQKAAYRSDPGSGKGSSKTSSVRGERRHTKREQVRREAEDHTREALSEIVTLGVSCYLQEVGYRGAIAALEDEATALCGPKGSHDPLRTATRYGHVPSSVRLLGRRVSVDRPRVRWADGSGDVPLKVLSALQEDTGEQARIITEIALLGVSQRGYRTAAGLLAGEYAGEGRAVFGDSKSTVNRCFVRATAREAEALSQRPLSGGAYRVLFIDGIGYADHLIVAAVGVRDDGEKDVLGLREGTTENAAVCSALLESLLVRGLDPTVRRLFVIDGGKGIQKAVRDVLGSAAEVHRCEAHKSRNVAEKLPEALWGEVRREMVTAWRREDAIAGEQHLAVLATKLERDGYKEAAGSLREGLHETFTLSRLGVGPRLRRLLATTNAIESSFSSVARMARRVTNWQSGDQVLRWVAIGLTLAQRTYRRHFTQTDMRELALALDRAAPCMGDPPLTA